MHETKPKVSVLVTSFNHAPFIEQCLQSALNQRTTFPYEIVVSDDVSTDDTRARIDNVAGRNPGRLRIISREKNLGNPWNFVDTYELCQGEYIAILDGDDYWTRDDKLQLQSDALDARPHWSGCFHRTIQRQEEGLLPREGVVPIECPEEPTIRDFIAAHYAYGQASMYRKHPSGALPPAWRVKGLIADWPLSILHSTLGTVGFLPQTMSVYRIHAKGIWSSSSTFDRIKKEFETVDELGKCLPADVLPYLNMARLASVNSLCRRLDACERSFALRLARFVGWPLDQVSRMLRNATSAPTQLRKAAVL